MSGIIGNHPLPHHASHPSSARDNQLVGIVEGDEGLVVRRCKLGCNGVKGVPVLCPLPYKAKKPEVEQDSVQCCSALTVRRLTMEAAIPRHGRR